MILGEVYLDQVTLAPGLVITNQSIGVPGMVESEADDFNGGILYFPGAFSRVEGYVASVCMASWGTYTLLDPIPLTISL